MQILLVANGNFKHFGARYYEPQKKLYNGLVRNGHNVYLFSDRDAARVGIFGKDMGKRRANQDFIKICANFQPELIIFVHADVITNESIQAAQTILPNVKTAQLNVDPIFIPHNIAMVRHKLPVVQNTFVTTAGIALKKFSSENGRVSFIPNMVDSSIEYPRCHERTDQEYDVFWGGRNSGKKKRNNVSFHDASQPRIAIPLFIEASGKAKIDHYGITGKWNVLNAEYFKNISNAKMGLNLSADVVPGVEFNADDIYLYSSDRISQYMGSGLLTFTSYKNKLNEMFAEDKEIIFFDEKEDLLEKIIFYKNNDAARQKIAAAGWTKYHNYYNEKLVAKYIVETCFEVPYSENYAWPTEKY